MRPSGREILIYLSITCKGDWSRIYNFINEKLEFDEEEVLKVNKALNCKAITMLDDEYPNHLKKIYRPPFVLFYRGDISLIQNENKCLSIVGSRKNTEYGEMMTKKIIKELDNSFITVSGLASGIDKVVAQTTIDTKGKTIAVLGSGIDYCYPKENEEIYNILKKDHLILSEYYGKIAPDPNYFRLRNRIVVGLGKGLLVTEAYGASGTLISVGFALATGKEVMCVPYHADEKSECNRLISQGASLVQEGKDILEILGKVF